eukprot:2547770-Lingulodinium_polyedra.AAC.1
MATITDQGPVDYDDDEDYEDDCGDANDNNDDGNQCFVHLGAADGRSIKVITIAKSTVLSRVRCSPAP